MMLAYSDIQNKIPDCERMRLQKLLHVILPKGKGMAPVVLRHFLKESYARLGLSATELKTQSLWPSFVKLLNSYGFLPRQLLDAEEQKQLEKNPYTIWPSKDYCILNADALDFLASQVVLKKENYLCFALQKLSSREKKDWCKYLCLNVPLSSERERTIVLYRHLARLNCQKKAMESRATESTAIEEKTMEQAGLKEKSALLKLPEFLDEVFPDDPALSPLVWFYRGVLGFYRCLEEAEKKKQGLPPLAQILLPLFKSGRLLISEEAPRPSQALRWRILRAKEEPPSFMQVDQFIPLFNLHSCNEQKQEGMLF